MAQAVLVRNLVKRYGDVVAVDGLSLEVHTSEVFGILGPNGAGKTTTLEILEGLRRPDAGEVVVAGVDVCRDPRAVKARVGVQLQQAAFFPRMTVEETVAVFASFHRRHLAVSSLLERVELVDRRRALVEHLSGGQRQRLSLALALLNDPQVVFLDEPTTGLDPQARRRLWELVETLRGEGCTVVFTTHSMEEAQRLADRVAIVDRGRVLVTGTPAELVRAYGGTSRVAVATEDPEACFTVLAGVEQVSRRNGEVLLATRTPLEVLGTLVERARAGRVRYHHLRLEEPSLEDVFLALTGRRLRE